MKIMDNVVVNVDIMLIFLKSNIYVYDVYFKHKHVVKENVVYVMTYNMS